MCSSDLELAYAKDKAFNPKVPAEAIAAVDAAKAKLASGELKLTVTKADAKGGV